MGEQFIIHNRKNQKIVGDIFAPGILSKKLVFITHGIGGHRKQIHIQSIANTFLVLGYTVVLWDATNSLGESEGKYADATVSSYYNDLEDVINRLSTKGIYQTSFVLVGHSIGSLCNIIYTNKHPDKVKMLVCISGVISGSLFLEGIDKSVQNNWKDIGYYNSLIGTDDGSKPNLKWGFVEDIIQYDALQLGPSIVIPVLSIVGDRDNGVPLKHQQMFFASLPESKYNQLSVLPDTGHSIKKTHQLADLKNIILLRLKRF